MQLSEARRPLCGQFKARPTENFSKAGNEVSHCGSTPTLPAHSAVHEVSTVVKCRGAAGSPDGACDVDRPPGSAVETSVSAAAFGGVDTEEFSRKCQGAFPVRPSNKPSTNDDCLADASKGIGSETDQDSDEFLGVQKVLEQEADYDSPEDGAEDDQVLPEPEDSRCRREGSLP